MTLCHSAENWRSTQTRRFAFRNEDQHLRSCPLIMADRSFHCLGILSQTSIAFTFWFHISVTKALFLSPSFLLLSLKAHCPSKNTECERACLHRQMGRKLPTVCALGPSHSIDLFPQKHREKE